MPTIWGRNISIQEAQALWGPLYANRETQLGATATILNFGDQPNAGKVNATTFVDAVFSASATQHTWTPNEAMSAWDTPFDLTVASNWKGVIPVATLNGTDEEMDTPDAAYWTRDDTAAQAMSMGAWVNVSDTATVKYIFVKDDENITREWSFSVDNVEIPKLILIDQSAGVSVSRPAAAAITVGAWAFVVVTYDGGGGATAANGINLYINGALSNGTANNNGAYVGMEDKTGKPTIGSLAGGAAKLYSGKMAGGPLGPFFVQAELTAAQILNMYRLEREALGV